MLLPALEALQHEGLDFQLVMCGSNPQDRGYERLVQHRIKNSGLRSRTTFTGFVSGDLKTDLLHAADLFVLPSYYENFGIAVVEAMLAGLPVVISDQVHIWPTIQQTESGWICECDVKSLTTQLRAALQSPHERQHRGRSAQHCAKDHYSWDAIAEQTISIYRDICTSL